MTRKQLYWMSAWICLGISVLFFLFFYGYMEYKENGIRSSVQPSNVDAGASLSEGSNLPEQRDLKRSGPVNTDLHPAYEIDARLNEEEKVLEATLGVAFDNPKTEDILFYLYDYPGYTFQIERVRFPYLEVEFEQHQNMVRIKNPYRARERIAIEMEFTIPVPRQGTRFGVKDDVWLLTNWYPLLGQLDRDGDWVQPMESVGFGDPFFYTYADYIVHMEAPQSFRWVTSGRHQREEKTGSGRLRRTWKADRVLTFSLVGSPRYTIDTIRVDGLEVQIAVTNPSRLKRVKRVAETSFQTFQEAFGSLPFSQVAVAETSRNTNHALEYPNLAIFSEDMYAGNQLEHWLPHEIGHLWWYNTVHPNEPLAGWIDEGLAELSVYYYRKQRYGASNAERFLAGYDVSTRNLSRIYPEGSLNKPLYAYHTEQEFLWTWYGKSVSLFRELKQSLGDERFHAFLQLLVREYQGMVIDEKHLDEALSHLLGKESQYFTRNAERKNREGLLEWTDETAR